MRESGAFRPEEGYRGLDPINGNSCRCIRMRDSSCIILPASLRPHCYFFFHFGSCQLRSLSIRPAFLLCSSSPPSPADFGSTPALRSLSLSPSLPWVVGNSQVALCSSHYALLTPVAEGLVSLLFPFVWQGAYIPVMPFTMRDVLEVIKGNILCAVRVVVYQGWG